MVKSKHENNINNEEPPGKLKDNDTNIKKKTILNFQPGYNSRK